MRALTLFWELKVTLLQRITSRLQLQSALNALLSQVLWWLELGRPARQGGARPRRSSPRPPRCCSQSSCRGKRTPRAARAPPRAHGYEKERRETCNFSTLRRLPGLADTSRRLSTPFQTLHLHKAVRTILAAFVRFLELMTSRTSGAPRLHQARADSFIHSFVCDMAVCSFSAPTHFAALLPQPSIPSKWDGLRGLASPRRPCPPTRRSPSRARAAAPRGR